MFKRKFLFLCLSILFIGYACDDDSFSAPPDNFDYPGQALIDNDSIVNLKLGIPNECQSFFHFIFDGNVYYLSNLA